MKKKKIIPFITTILFAVIFIYSIYKLFIYYKDTNKNIQENKELIEEVITYSEESDDITTIDFDKLKSINQDTVGWLRLNNDKINYPIVQTSDNEYYLKHGFKKEYNQAGAIFMDYENKTLEDQNIVIYGHAMRNGRMFGSLSDIFKKDYFDIENNKYIEIIDPLNNIIKYQIFSYYTIEAEDYYLTTTFKSDETFQEFITTIKNRSAKKIDVEIKTDDKVLTLSTCAGTSGSNKRRVIHAKRI